MDSDSFEAGMASRVFVMLLLMASMLAAAVPNPAAQGDSEPDSRIWPEFVSLMKTGRIGEAHVRPVYTNTATMLAFLEKLRSRASWAEWEREPEVHRVGKLVHFVVRLSEDGKPGT
jgi:hypothetical protein